MAKNYNDASAPKSFSEAVRKVWVNAVAAGILSIIIYVSLGVVFKTVAPNYVGYQPAIVDEEGHRVKDGGFIPFEDGEVSFPETDHDKGYGITVSQEMVSLIFMGTVFTLMIYSVMWAYGDHQRNSVSIGQTKHDKYEGVKVGALSSIVSILALAFTLISKLLSCFTSINLMPLSLSCLSFSNFTFMPILKPFVTVPDITIFSRDPSIDRMLFGCSDISWLGIAVMVVPIIYKILICHLAYNLGYRQISIKEKIVYKNNK